jgi:hypothetical protein
MLQGVCVVYICKVPTPGARYAEITGVWEPLYTAFWLNEGACVMGRLVYWIQLRRCANCLRVYYCDLLYFQSKHFDSNRRQNSSHDV